MIPKDTIEQIKNAMDIVEVVSDFVPLQKSGSGYKARSPFTNEKTPSFHVTPAKQIFKCFSTQKGGDAITFVMEHEGMSYVEALRYIAGKYGIEIQERQQSPEEIQNRTQKDSLYIMMEYAKDYYKDILQNSTEGKSVGLSYFKERGFNNSTLDKFDLGFSLDKWDGLYNIALKNQFKEDVLEKTGLIIKKEDGKIYDRFRGRVMFPIHNLSGKVIAFGARILITDKNQPKYINSPETEIYHKSDALYGIFQAKNEIRNKENCYLVEGYTDVISMHQAGITNVVASSGTALTEGQIKLINRFTDTITVLYDGDAAGIKASVRGIDLILEQGLNVYALVFPDGDDPDSFVKKVGAEAFDAYIKKNSTDFISFITHLFLDEAGDDPIKKAGVIRKIVESLAKVPDAIKRATYFEQCSKLLKIDEQLLISEYNKIIIKERQEQGKKRLEEEQNLAQEESLLNQPSVIRELSSVGVAPAKNNELQTLHDQEEEILRILMVHGQREVVNKEGQEIKLFNYILDELIDFQFNLPLHQEIFEIIKLEVLLNKGYDHEVFLRSGNTDIVQKVSSFLISRYQVSDNWRKFEVIVIEEKDKIEKVTFLMINRLKWRYLKWKQRECLMKMSELSEEETLTDIQEEYMNYKRAEMAISKILGIVIS